MRRGARLAPVDHGGTLVNALGAAESLYSRCPPEIARLALPRLRPHQYAITQRSQLNFPVTPSTYVSARDDRLVLAAWSRVSVAKDLAHGAWVEMDGDHSPMLGRPAELADVLSAIRT